MNQSGSRASVSETGLLARPDRLTVLAFLSDTATEQVLRDGLGDLVANGIDVRRGTVRTAITAMAKLPTPEVLIVDIAGEEQPLHALGELSDVVEPGVRVLVIGDTDDVDFYRHITRGMGVMEYIFKPITREAVARHFAPLITRKTIGADATRGGRVIAIMGARGGVGATTIAGNLAWHFGVIATCIWARARCCSAARPAPACAWRWKRRIGSTRYSSSAPPSRSPSACTCWLPRKSSASR
jgi:pilus assembly protein CpaE